VEKADIDPYTFGLGAEEPGHEGETYWNDPLPVHHQSHLVGVHAARVFALRDLAAPKADDVAPADEADTGPAADDDDKALAAVS
jgi:hypothetical protein